MEARCAARRCFLDPFCGSGTVLFEALRRGAAAVGVEVNPAAWHIASLAAVGTGQAAAALANARRVVVAVTSAAGHDGDGVLRDLLLRAIVAVQPPVRTLLAAVLLLAMGNATDLTAKQLARAMATVEDAIFETSHAVGSARCMLADARAIPLADATVDAVITSPPYINVFNYHQNYRPAVEQLGWQPLEAARSEIGANRKHRQNRFLTVIQYALDMAAVINELMRLMTPGAPLVLVLGRTSSVLGAAFRNGEMIEALIRASGFVVGDKAERVFTNRYGEEIYEDILVAHRGARRPISDAEARGVGLDALRQARAQVDHKHRGLLDQAISMVPAIRGSPLLALSTPLTFKSC